MKARTPLRLLVLSLCGVVSTANAATDVAIVAGQGDGVRTTALAGRIFDWRVGQLGDRWPYEIGGEWQLARWSADRGSDGVTRLIDASLTAVLTLRPVFWRAGYVEGGFGVHFLSEDHIGTDRDFGGRFQFGEFIGAGVTFGARRRYTAGLRVQHVSNGSTRSQNDGVTFVQGLARYSF